MKGKMMHLLRTHTFLTLALWTGIATVLMTPICPRAAQTNIVGPPGSGKFGTSVTVLPNGNIVVTDPDYDEGAANIGAVHLYDGATLALISTLKGGSANDTIGSLGVKVLSNGNYVVVSEWWDNPSPSRVDAGAVTWCSGTLGLSGVVSAANSLVGSSSNNLVGRGSLNNGVVALANGNYAVGSVFWDNPGTLVPDVGAVTFCNGVTGRVGFVDGSNSLVGSRTNDRVSDVVALANGNYVVQAHFLDHPVTGATDSGAVTWASGTTGITGTINANNSLIGGTAGDFVSHTVKPLPNGNYVVAAHNWDNLSPLTTNAGAAIFCNGSTGRTGLVSAANALIGGSANDRVGISGVIVLTSGKYVVSSPNWSKPSPVLANAGAATLCNGTTGLTGLVTTANSLTGGTASDLVSFGSPGVTPLPNGDFVVASLYWNNPSPLVSSVGAVTLCDGATGRAGQVVSATNSVVGSRANDWLGRVTALTNGNYVVYSPEWDNPSPVKLNVGVAAWCSGITGRTGTLSAANALVGSTANDRLTDGFGGVTSLATGNYVTVCLAWDNLAAGSNDVGAVTFCDGGTGRIGEISPTNSLVGTVVGDRVGSGSVAALANGNYVVSSPVWDSPAAPSAGAVTWCDGTLGRMGEISVANSLIGSTISDTVGYDGVFALSDGNYYAVSKDWANGGILDAGAITFASGGTGILGGINSTNSLLGTSAGAFDTYSQAYDAARSRLVIGRSAANIVTLFTLEHAPAARPTLMITRTGIAQVTLSWTPATPGFVLQETLSLSPTNWVNAVSGSTNPVVVPATLPTKFYRLFKP